MEESLLICPRRGRAWLCSSGGKVEEIGDSHFGGILQTGAGIHYNIVKGWALRVEYRFQYMSEPFRTDQGLNTHNFLLGVSL